MNSNILMILMRKNWNFVKIVKVEKIMKLNILILLIISNYDLNKLDILNLISSQPIFKKDIYLFGTSYIES